MNKNYSIIALGITLIVAAQLLFAGNDGWQWIPRIILTITGAAVAGAAWSARKGKKG